MIMNSYAWVALLLVLHLRNTIVFVDIGQVYHLIQDGDINCVLGPAWIGGIYYIATIIHYICITQIDFISKLWQKWTACSNYFFEFLKITLLNGKFDVVIDEAPWEVVAFLLVPAFTW